MDSESELLVLSLRLGVVVALSEAAALAVPAASPLDVICTDGVAADTVAGAEGAAGTLRAPVCVLPTPLLPEPAGDADAAAAALLDITPLREAETDALGDGLLPALLVVEALRKGEAVCSVLRELDGDPVLLAVAQALSGRVAEGVWVGVRVGVGVGVLGRVEVPVGVGVLVPLALTESDPVGDALPLSLEVAVSVPVTVLEPVPLGVALGVGVALREGRSEAVEEAALAETLAHAPGLREEEGVAVGVGERERLEERLLEGVGLAEPVGVPLVDAVGVPEEEVDAEAEGEGVSVG